MASCTAISHELGSHVNPWRTPWSTQIAKFMGPPWGPPGSCRPQIGPKFSQWALLSGFLPTIWIHVTTKGLPTRTACLFVPKEKAYRGVLLVLSLLISTGCFFPKDILLEYWIEHDTIGRLCWGWRIACFVLVCFFWKPCIKPQLICKFNIVNHFICIYIYTYIPISSDTSIKYPCTLFSTHKCSPESFY